jgi:hypothetical protein
MSSGTLYHVTLARTDVSEKVSSASSGFFKLIGFYKFPETSVRGSATRYKVTEDIFNWRHRESIPDDSGLPILKVTYLFLFSLRVLHALLILFALISSYLLYLAMSTSHEVPHCAVFSDLLSHSPQHVSSSIFSHEPAYMLTCDRLASSEQYMTTHVTAYFRLPTASHA